jgi:hypothetical protein
MTGGGIEGINQNGYSVTTTNVLSTDFGQTSLVDIDKDAFVFDVKPMTELIAESLAPRRFRAFAYQASRELATLPPDVVFSISGSHPQYANFSLYASTAQQPLAEFAGHPLVKLPLELTLRTERTISLTITRADTSQPFVGVNIDARQEEGLASWAFDTSDELGKAKLTLPPGKFNLRGSPPLPAFFPNLGLRAFFPR